MKNPAELEKVKLGLVLLGASQFPNFPKALHLDNPSFRNSARAFQNIMESDNILLSGRPTVLDLFDSDLSPREIILRIRDFLKAEANITDLVLYYCGHGSFLSDRTYFLMIRATEPDSEAFTGLPWRQMRHTLEPHLANRRVYIVLDCCFAGRAIAEFQSVALGPLIEEQTFHALPRRGTALVAASAHGDVALAPGERSLTMFTGALVEAIEHGLQGRARTLSLRDVVMGIRHRLPELYPGRAVLPQIHDPVQPEGDVSATPLFVNRAFQPPKEPDATDAEREMFEFAVSDLGRPLAGTRLAALATLEGLINSTKSRPFREKILEQIRNAEAENDSRAVVAGATQILQRFPTLVEPSPTACASESGLITHKAGGVEESDDVQRLADWTDHQQDQVRANAGTLLNDGNKSAIDAAGIGSVSDGVTKPARMTVLDALWKIVVYGIAPGFVLGFIHVENEKYYYNSINPLFSPISAGLSFYGEMAAQLALPALAGYNLAKHANAPILASIIGFAITGVAMGVCELVTIARYSGFSPAFYHESPVFVVSFCVLGILLGWGLFTALCHRKGKPS